MEISFWKKDKIVFKKFRTKQKLFKFLVKNDIYTFNVNGFTCIFIGGIKENGLL